MPYVRSYYHYYYYYYKRATLTSHSSEELQGQVRKYNQIMCASLTRLTFVQYSVAGYECVKSSVIAHSQLLVSHCVSDISRWFFENEMLLNPSKTEAVLFGTRAERKKLTRPLGSTLLQSRLHSSSTVKLLGVTLDEDLSLNRHVTNYGKYRWRTQLPHERSQAHSSAHQPLRCQGGRSRSCDVTVGLLQRPTVRNFRSKRGTPAGHTDFTRSGRVFGYQAPQNCEGHFTGCQ